MNVPVYLVGASGKPNADNPHCAPCIICALSADNGSQYESNLQAMLDSGAYPNAIDTGLFERMGLSPTGQESLHSPLTIETVMICRGTLLVHALSETLPVQTSFSVTAMRDRGMPYDLVLGRQFLTLFDFGYTQHDGWFLRIPEFGHQK